MQARMSLSLLCALSFGSRVSGVARRTCVVNSASPCSTVSGVGRLCSAMITIVAGPTVTRGSWYGVDFTPRCTQPHVHAVGSSRWRPACRRPRGSAPAGHAEVDHQGGRALPEPVEVLVEEPGWPSCTRSPSEMPSPSTKPESKTETVASARFQLAVDPDQDLSLRGSGAWSWAPEGMRTNRAIPKCPYPWGCICRAAVVLVWTTEARLGRTAVSRVFVALPTATAPSGSA